MSADLRTAVNQPLSLWSRFPKSRWLRASPPRGPIVMSSALRFRFQAALTTIRATVKRSSPDQRNTGYHLNAG